MEAMGLREYFRVSVEPVFEILQSKFLVSNFFEPPSSSSSSSSAASIIGEDSTKSEPLDVGVHAKAIRESLLNLIESSGRIVDDPKFIHNSETAKYFEITIQQTKILMTLLEFMWWSKVKKLVDFMKVPIREPDKAGKHLLFDLKFFEMIYNASSSLPDLSECIELTSMFLKYGESKIYFPYVGYKYVSRIVLSIFCADRIINSNLDVLSATTTSTKISDLAVAVESGGNNDSDVSRIGDGSYNNINNKIAKLKSPYHMMPKLFSDVFRATLIRELRRLSAPDWIRDAAYQVVRDILNTPDGLISVMNVYLNDISENSSSAKTVDSTKLYMMIAKFLTSVPLNVDKTSFFRTISEQILDAFITVIHVLNKNKNIEKSAKIKIKDAASIAETAHQLMILLALMISRVSHLQPAISKEVIFAPMLKPIFQLNLCDSRHLMDSIIELSSEDAAYNDGTIETDLSSYSKVSKSNSKSIFSYDDIAMCVYSVYSILTSSPAYAPIIDVLLDSKGLEYFLTFNEMLEKYSMNQKIKVIAGDNYVRNLLEKSRTIVQYLLTRCSNSSVIIAVINSYLFCLPKTASKTGFTIDTSGFLMFLDAANVTEEGIKFKNSLGLDSDSSDLTINTILRAKASLIPPSSNLNSSGLSAGARGDLNGENVDDSGQRGNELEDVVNILRNSSNEISSQFSLKVSMKAQYFCNFMSSLKTAELKANKEPNKNEVVIDSNFTIPVMSLMFLHYLRIYLEGGELSETIGDKSEKSATADEDCNILIDKSISESIIFMTILSSVNIEDILSDGIQILKILCTFLEGFSKSSYVIARSSVIAASDSTAEIEFSEAIISDNNAKNVSNLDKKRIAPQVDPKKKKVLIEEISSTANDISEEKFEVQQKNVIDNDISISAKINNDCIDIDSEMRSNDATNDNADVNLDQLVIVMDLLSNILEFGSRPPDEEEIIRRMMHPLMSISWSDIQTIRESSSHDDDAPAGIDSDDETENEDEGVDSRKALSISELAQQLVVKIMTRSKSKASSSSSSSDFKSVSDVIDLVKVELKSISPSDRAMGLHMITDNIRKYASTLSSKLDLKDITLLLDTIIPFLADPDSFVYLHAIQTIRVVSDLKGCRPMVVDKLTNIFETVAATILSIKKDSKSAASGGGSTSLPPVSATNALLLPIGRYAVLSEVLSLVLKRAGEAAAQYTPRVVSISVILSRITLSKAEISLMDRYVDLYKTRLIKSKEQEQDGDDELEEQEHIDNNGKDEKVKSPGTSSKLDKFKYEGEEKESAARVADYALLRQSSIILLSEAVVCSGWSCTRIADVLDVVSHVLILETSYSQYSISCRRAAALVLRHILNGLNKKLFSLSDAGQILKKCYSSVKIGCDDRDNIVRFHCGVALSALDEMYLDKFKPQKAELKVRILDWG